MSAPSRFSGVFGRGILAACFVGSMVQDFRPEQPRAGLSGENGGRATEQLQQTSQPEGFPLIDRPEAHIEKPRDPHEKIEAVTRLDREVWARRNPPP